MPKRLDVVQVTADGRDVEISWKLSQRLRGGLVGARHPEVAQEFANKGTSRPIVLDRAGKRALLRVVFVAMQEGSDQQARDLVELRNTLRADLGEG
jgi:hypothetical protein